MFDETAIREIAERAERDGAPASVAGDLEADLLNALFAFRQRMNRVNRHTQVLRMVTDCKGSVTQAAAELEMSREGVYKHLRKSTENPIGVDAQAA